MRTILTSAALLLLGGFAFGATGCVTEYQTVSTSPTYSGTTLPAASRVALVMEFRGGTPSPEERADVRAILSDYLTGKGSVLVDEPSAADYLVHVFLERRNPANPAEWTVVETYSAHSMSSVYGDDYRWPDGIVEDETYQTTSFSYVGFGLFYPIWFDAWDSPWHRGRIRMCPPPFRHDRFRDVRWLEEHRFHRPDRWPKDRRPDSDRKDDRRDDHDRSPGMGNRDNHRPENVRPPERPADRRAGDRSHNRHDDTPRPGKPAGAVQPPPPNAPFAAKPPAQRPQPVVTPVPQHPHNRPVQSPPASRPTVPPSRPHPAPQPAQQPPVANPPDRRPQAIVVPGGGVMVPRPAPQPPSAQPVQQQPARPNRQVQQPNQGGHEVKPQPPRGDPSRSRMERRNPEDTRKVQPQPKRNEVNQSSPRELRRMPPPKEDPKDPNKDENQQRH
jgi:hypothetical protein